MKENGYVLDRELAEFQGKEPNFYQASFYKGEYMKLKSAKDSFDSCEDVIINSYRPSYKHAKTTYTLRHKGMEENQWYVIPKIYFEYLKNKGIKLYERK